MSAEAWVGVAAIVATVLVAFCGAATAAVWNIATKLKSIDDNTASMSRELTNMKDEQSSEHAELWKAIDDLVKVSRAHEGRLIRMESTQRADPNARQWRGASTDLEEHRQTEKENS